MCMGDELFMFKKRISTDCRKQAYDDYKIVMKSEAISEEEPEEVICFFVYFNT